MNSKDKNIYIARYEKLLKKYAYSPQALGWGKHGRQEIRFRILTEPVLRYPNSTVLDVGCGFGDLYSYLINHQWTGRYVGIDIVPGLLNVAREKHPNVEFIELDITESEGKLSTFDFVLASGILNAKLSFEDNKDHISKVIQSMVMHCRVAACVDFLSSYVDYQKTESWHTDPGWVFKIAKNLSRRIILRHDYMPFEFCIIIYKNDRIQSNNTFDVN